MSAHRTASFEGFQGIARGTSIPNVFFSEVLPRLREPGELLAFLWASRLVQGQRGDTRFVTGAQIWRARGAAEAFRAFGVDRERLEGCLERLAGLGVLLSLRVVGRESEETVYFLNTPSSRRAVARARAGDLELHPGPATFRADASTPPDIFRLYEEHIGTITPFVGERLADAAAQYPADWIEDAFREAAERNVRNWRYIERILQNWAEGGRADETSQRDSFESRKRRYLGDQA